MKNILQKNNHARLGLSLIKPVPAIFLKTPLDDCFLKPANNNLFKASFYKGYITSGRGVVSNYSYDALNRVNSVQFTDNSENITYVYESCTNGVGRVCQVTDPSGITTLEYDVYGNITQQTKVELGQTYVTQYTYDSVDQITSITYPNGIQLTYQRDDRSRITDITLNHVSLSNPQSIVSGVQYRADNQMAQCTLGNGVVENRAYDLQGRLTSQQLSDNLFSRNYSYDANGNILNVDSNTLDPAYSYDALNRLLSENNSSIDDSAFTYDPIGNRLTQTQNTTETAYRYKTDSSQLTQVGSTALTLDGSGNTLTDGIKAFAYNDRNQLETFTESGSSVASYEYDYKNLRTQKQINGGDANIYRYDLQGRRIQHNTNNQTNTSTVYLGWQPVAHIQHAANGDVESITYLTSDQVGAPRLGTSQNKTVVWSWEVDAFGSAEPNADVDNNGQVIAIENRLPGQYVDLESGLKQNWNRYYDDEIGRYISSDRIGLSGGLNTYVYVDNNPLIYFDAEGLKASRTTARPFNSRNNRKQRNLKKRKESLEAQLMEINKRADAKKEIIDEILGQLADIEKKLHPQFPTKCIKWSCPWDNVSDIQQCPKPQQSFESIRSAKEGCFCEKRDPNWK